MRFIVYGAGAIGGVLGGRLFQAGEDVVLIARGPHHDAIRDVGLTVESPTGSVTLPVPVVATVASSNRDAYGYLAPAAVAMVALTLLPMFLVGPEIRDGRLIRVLNAWEIGAVPIHAVYPDNKNIASKVRRFVDFLVKRLPKDAIS